MSGFLELSLLNLVPVALACSFITGDRDRHVVCFVSTAVATVILGTTGTEVIHLLPSFGRELSFPRVSSSKFVVHETVAPTLSGDVFSPLVGLNAEGVTQHSPFRVNAGTLNANLPAATASLNREQQDDDRHSSEKCFGRAV